MKIFIRNMVSIRCKMLVKQELENLGIHFSRIELGEVEMKAELSVDEHNLLKAALLKSGLELMDDKNALLIEKVKNVIIEMVHYGDTLPKTNFSDYIGNKLNMNFKSLSILFSETKGITIDHFIIIHKIEKAKELIVYDQLNLTEIAHKLNYSSVAHLSNQFKKITGLTPSFFKSLNRKKLKANRNI